MARLRFNAALREIEVEGDEKLLGQIYGDLKDLVRIHLTKAQPAEQVDQGEVTEEDGKDRKKRAPIKKGGPSCASRITELKEQKFFSELKDNKAINDALASKGHNYEPKHIAAALIHMTKTGKLRRMKKDGSWYYQNP